MAAAMTARPLGVRNSRYLFRVRGRETGYTLLEMANARTLQAICGGDLDWLEQSFPARIYLVGATEHFTTSVSQGINALAAAKYLASLCVDAEARRLAKQFAPARPEWWWRRLWRWLGRRMPLRHGFINPRTGWML